ncbi:tetratricopeptide repeat protein [Xanthobacter sp. V0B-10]|uniref:tetratricopeptide repeat protein n=1 Tax=Xanthobacter albus TaxID=3119929 RepID=UPI003727F8CE
MTDIFHEIQEDLRRERMRKLWDRYGIVLIAAVVLAIAGAAAWSGYSYWRQQQAIATSVALDEAGALSAAGKYAEAEAAFQEIAKTGPAGYRAIALFRAAEAAAKRDPAAGVSAFDAIAGDSRLPPLARDMARLRAGLMVLDTSDLSAVKQRVGDLAAGTGPLRNPAREVLALAQMKAGDLPAANKTATEITEDAEATGGIRSRAELIRRLTATPAAPAEAPAAPAAPAAAQ